MNDEREQDDIEYTSILSECDYENLTVDEKQLYNEKIAYENYLRYEEMLFPDQNFMNETKVDIFPREIRAFLKTNRVHLIKNLIFTFSDEDYYREFCKHLNYLDLRYTVYGDPFSSRNSFFSQVNVRLSNRNSRDDLYSIFRNVVPEKYESEKYSELEFKPRYYSCDVY